MDELFTFGIPEVVGSSLGRDVIFLLKAFYDEIIFLVPVHVSPQPAKLLHLNN